MLYTVLSILVVSLFTATSGNAAQNQLIQVTNYSTCPTKAGMYVYKPNTLPDHISLVVAIHDCQGTAQSYFSGTQYATQADHYEYIIVYPSSPNNGTCWDVSSNATLTHNGGSDSLDIVFMVTYAISTYGVASNLVYVTGTGSGAMMGGVLAAAYPDFFRAASLYSGAPYGCFAGSGDDIWNSACANGQVTKTAAEWGALVQQAYPGYTGARPGMTIWHGTADATLNYENFGEEIKQWTNVLGVSQTPAWTDQNDPQSGYTASGYGLPPVAVGYSGAVVGHPVPIDEITDLFWFCIAVSCVYTPPSSTPSVSCASTSTTTSASPTGTAQAKYGQCGGVGWPGPTTCATGSTCTYLNPYYSECL